MGIKEKVEQALRRHFEPVEVLLIDEDGITGYVVSSQFKGVTSIDRQRMIDKTLRNADAKLSAAERRKVLMIAALTPIEYDSFGPEIVSRNR